MVPRPTCKPGTTLTPRFPPRSVEFEFARQAATLVRMKIYTRTGDTGDTGLFGGARVGKDDPRVEAYGTVDELNSCLGVIRALGASAETDESLLQIQRDLFTLGAELACAPGNEDKL